MSTRKPRPPLTCNQCGRRYPSGQQGGHCASCHESFSSDVVFDAHRVGRFEPMERRCLTAAEMTAKGYVQRDHGYWGRPGRRPVPTRGGGAGATGTAGRADGPGGHHA